MNNRLAPLFFLLISLALTAVLSAQPTSATLRVGVSHTPPYCIRDTEGNWTGMTVELWRHLAEADRIAYKLVELDRDTDYPEALRQHRIDVALPTDLAHQKTDSVSFLQLHHLTTLAVALPKQSSLWTIARNLFTLRFLYVVLSLSAILLAIGALIYYMERKQNEDQFGGDRSLLQGIGSGFWWAGVTLTTIGYGDKSPKTLGGRIVAMLWMLVAMGVSAALTASVISAMSTKPAISFPDDLRDMKVAAMADSPAAEYLSKNDYSFETFPSVLAGLEALNAQEVSAVVADATALSYELNSHESVAAKVIATDEGPVAFSLMLREDDVLTDRLDAHVVKFILSPAWRTIVRKYGGSKVSE